MGYKKGSSVLNRTIVYKSTAPFMYTVPCCKCGGSGQSDVYSNQFVCESCVAKQSLASFFAAVAAVAEQRVAEKKAAATEKKQANLSILGRAQFKKSGAILTGIEDRNGKESVVMHVTINSKGKVTSCLNPETGEACEARYWSGHCCHGDRALQYEAARTDDQSSAPAHDMIDAPAAGSLAEWVERVTEEASWDERRKAFEAIKKEIAHIEMRHEMGLVAELLPEMAAAGDTLTHVEDSIASGELDWSDPFAGMSEQEQREAYRAMYPDDFAFVA